MSNPGPPSTLAFTKLVVDDLEAMARYYGTVFGFSEIGRFQAHIDGSDVDEIMLGSGGQPNGLILLKFLQRDTVPTGEVIPVFATTDIHALIARGVAAGGTQRGEVFDPDMPNAGLVGFLADPEGHLCEVIQRQSV